MESRSEIWTYSDISVGEFELQARKAKYALVSLGFKYYNIFFSLVEMKKTLGEFFPYQHNGEENHSLKTHLQKNKTPPITHYPINSM